MLLTGLLVLLALTALSAVLLRGTGVGALDALLILFLIYLEQLSLKFILKED